MWHQQLSERVSDFSLLKFGHIRSCLLTSRQVSTERWQLDLELIAEYGGQYTVTLRMIGVTNLEMAPIQNGVFQFGELHVTSLEEDGLEEINYAVRDYLAGFDCYCRDIQIEKIEAIADTP